MNLHLSDSNAFYIKMQRQSQQHFLKSKTFLAMKFYNRYHTNHDDDFTFLYLNVLFKCHFPCFHLNLCNIFRGQIVTADIHSGVYAVLVYLDPQEWRNL